MPRLILPDPTARSAVWTRRLAVIGVILACTAIATSHHAALGPRHALGLLALSLFLSVLAMPLGVAAAVVIWRDGLKGTGSLLLGLVLALATLAYPATLAAKLVRQPLRFEASTDLVHPPVYSLSTKAFAVRGDLGTESEPVRSGAARAEEPQPVVLDAPADEAFADVVAVLKTLRWRVIDAVAPGGRSGLGHVDAVAYSAVMHLPEDLVIRIRPLAGQTRVDIRSMSRLRLPDFGDDAKNVQAVADALKDQDENQ